MAVRVQIKKAGVKITLGPNRNKDWDRAGRETPKLATVVIPDRNFSEPRN